MHTGVITPVPSVERAATARLLSIGFSPPDAATLDELRSLAAALGARELSAALEDAGADGVACDYESMFGGAVACSPYEAGYEPDPFRGTRQIADVAGFYRAFGVTSEGPAAERPDHVACELEFLAFLTARRVAAVEEGDRTRDAILAEVEDAFLRSHLASFMGPFCDAVAAESQSPVFTALAVMGRRFIDQELARHGIDPPKPGRSAATAVDGDEVTCGMGGGCALTDILGRSEMLRNS